MRLPFVLHLPVNHRYRSVYRFLIALAGGYVIVFGIAGVVANRGHAVFARTHTEALGLRTNLAFAVLSIVVGAVVLLGDAIGRNLDHLLGLVGGVAFLLVGIVMLTLLETPLNILNFTVATCVVSFIIGLVMFTAGLYTRSESSADVPADERHRHAPLGRTRVSAGGGSAESASSPGGTARSRRG